MLFFSNDTTTTQIYTLSLHDALPISWRWLAGSKEASGSVQPFIGRIEFGKHDDQHFHFPESSVPSSRANENRDRKSTRLNSSHVKISYAVFCLKKKKKNNREL